MKQRQWLYLGSSFLVACLLIGCGNQLGVVPTPAERRVEDPEPVMIASKTQCAQAIARAYAMLNAVKEGHVLQRQGRYMDWSRVEFTLSAALSNQQNHNYSSCVVNARAVMDYVERDQNYLQWKRSLNF